jgi:ADP-heptose:LPS heptosyltransferase
VLVRRLRSAGLPVVVTTGPADADVRAWLGEIDGAGLAVAPDLSPRQLAALYAVARAFVGNDSGPTHVAAAVGCPTVALFGPTNPAQWRPLGHGVTVLAGAGPGTPDPWAGLTTERVLAALVEAAAPTSVLVGEARPA